jgi:hypothetical protein
LPPTDWRSPSFVVLVCIVSIVFDGYDLVVYGTTIPPILVYQDWAVTPEQAGAIDSYAPASSRVTALGWSLGIGRIGAMLGPILGGADRGQRAGLPVELLPVRNVRAARRRADRCGSACESGSRGS